MNIETITQSVQRTRLVYGILALGVMASGLLWRSPVIRLSGFASKYGGDAIWALMVFCFFAILFPRLSPLRLTLLSLGFAWAIEFSQLYHADWIDRIRSTRIGALILGNIFHAPDLLAYLFGVALGLVGEGIYYRKRAVPCIAELQELP